MDDTEILRSLVDRVIRLKEEIQGAQSDIADLYSEAHSQGFDKKAIKEVVKRAMMRQEQLTAYEQLDLITETYWTNYNGSSLVQADARTREYMGEESGKDNPSPITDNRVKDSIAAIAGEFA